MITIGELMAHARDAEAREAGVPGELVAVARRAGMLPADVAALAGLSRTAPPLCIVVRCPKASAYAWQGLLPAKVGAVSKKSGESGVVSIQKLRRTRDGVPLFRRGEPMVDSALYVSDYDLMGIWQADGANWRRVRVTAPNSAKRGGYGPAAAELLRRLNATLVTRIQHGCQDDWRSADNRGVKPDDGFAGFVDGTAAFLDGPAACRAFYARTGLGVFPYDPATGAFTGA